MKKTQWNQYAYTVRLIDRHQLDNAGRGIRDVFGSDDEAEAVQEFIKWFRSLETGEVVQVGSYCGAGFNPTDAMTYERAEKLGY